MSHCSQYPAVNAWYLSDPYMQGTKMLHHRTGYNASGQGVHSVHSSSFVEHFNSTFLAQCGQWANYLNISLFAQRNTSLSWVGDIGVGGCKTGYHGSARAFDLSHIRYADGQLIDCNWSWQQSLEHQRRYVGLAATLRYYFGTVITWGYTPDTSHRNHIHFDNGASVQAIRTDWMTDTLIVQMACKYLNGASISIDGAWGNQTETAFVALLNKFKMQCYSPKTNLSHARSFLDLIVNHGLGNHAAGYIHLNC